MQLAVLTGAGVSAESGVPTFRDVETGLWAHVDPYEISSTTAWAGHPDRVWAWYLWRHHLMRAAAPNAGHRAIADFAGRATVTVITQNIDDLHERAGSSGVAHLHGSLSRFRCDRCDTDLVGAVPDMPRPVESLDPPRCGCGGTIRPDVVWFGEPLPSAAWELAVEAVRGADVVVVAGTSNVVYPAAGLPDLALRNGIPVIEVNPEPTPLSGRATRWLREPAGTGLPGLLDRLPALLG